MEGVVINLEKIGRTLLNDYLGWGWDAANRLYGITEAGDGEEVVQLVHTFTEHPVDEIHGMLLTGHFKPEVKAVALACENWRHPTWEEVQANGFVEDAVRMWNEIKDEPVPFEGEELIEKTKTLYEAFVGHFPPSANRLRIESKGITVLDRSGHGVYVYCDKDHTDRVTVWDSAEDGMSFGGAVKDALIRLFGIHDEGEEHG